MHESSKGISWVTAHLLDERQVLKLCDQGQQMWALHFNGRGLGRWEGYYYYKSTDKCELSARRSDQNCFEEANEELPSISRRRITQCIQVTFYYNNYNISLTSVHISKVTITIRILFRFPTKESIFCNIILYSLLVYKWWIIDWLMNVAGKVGNLLR